MKLQIFDRSHLKVNDETATEIFNRYNSHEMFVKAIQNIRYFIDAEYQTKDELVPINIQNVYEILDEVMTEQNIPIL